MNQPDMIIYGTLITVTMVLVWLVWYSIRQVSREEAESATLTVDTLRASVNAQLLPGPLMWAVWKRQLSFKEAHLILRDESGMEVTKIVFPFFVPIGGVQQHFELNGLRYEVLQEGVLSGRTWLRDAHSGDIVLSCQHGWRFITFYRAKSEVVLCRVNWLKFLASTLALTQGGAEIGRLFTAYECNVRVLSLNTPSLSVLEQCFVVANIPGRRVIA